ncbi:polysaccharide export protein EpsE [Methylotenera sp.]|jgi:polysaccharide export outer membrane protein|uniref:polysaccharide export protein EpsE n=1 Tax=Methylotenera sp. TaxID=2051956 RepID=UPI0027357CCE|nr:polysaccharide export protein EpsE [Methylotenera sp.]MDP3776333.1 polysaccharide export protein EpsE [Methylotenera sp.]
MRHCLYIKSLFITLLALTAFTAHGVELETTEINSTQSKDYTLAPGDAIRVLVFQNPDLTLDTRVTESGSITYPLIGSVKVGNMSIAQAEGAIASALKSGGFVQQPQVNIVLLQVRGNQVSVLGAVNRPGRFPLESFNTKLSDMLAYAGGINTSIGTNGGGADQVIVVGIRNGVPFRKEIDIPNIFLNNHPQDDIEVAAGDVIFVPTAPQYYIYGEAQRPGSFRIKRNMTIQQAVAEAGGPSVRGTERGMKIYRSNANGELQVIRTKHTDLVQADDVIFVTESLF